MSDIIASTAKAIFAILIICWLLNKRLVPKPLPGIPYNNLTRYLPFGDLFTLGIHYLFTSSSFDWFASQCLSLNSPIVQILVPSFSTRTPVILIADLHEVKDILLKRVHEIDRATLMHDWFGVVIPHATIGMKTSMEFRRQRRLFNCLLGPGFMDEVAVPVFGEAVEKLIRLWGLKGEVEGGGSFAAYQDLRRTTLDAIWKVLLGDELGLNDASIAHVQAKRDTKTANLASTSYPFFYDDFALLLKALVWTLTGVSHQFYSRFFKILPQFQTANARTKELIESFLHESREQCTIREPTIRCGLGDLVRLQQQDRTVPDEAIIDEILELLITGHETTASSTGWALKYLADHQSIQDRLSSSLIHAFPNAAPDKLPAALDIYRTDIPYLDAFLAEVLRISATGPVSFRETLVDVEIMGYSIPANTPVFLVTQSTPNYVLTPETLRNGKSSSVEKTASEPCLPTSTSTTQDWTSRFADFVPERWLREDGSFNPDAGLSIPFSVGKRSCFGKKFAMLELRLLIAMSVLTFRFEELPEKRSKYSSNDGLTRQPKCCYVLPVRREEQRK